MAEFLKSVEQGIIARHLFARGENILVAVSGGLDSMVLLHVLSRLAKKYKWRLIVAHFNHQLRGRSSDADERLVNQTARTLGLIFVADRGNVRQVAREHGWSIEMAARKLRHDFFACAAAENRSQKIALAHQADDQVELFFVRLLRGAGGEGAGGMKWLGPSPANPKIPLARPLLDQPKTALAAYAKSEGVKYREDATNAHTDILRNKIRHGLLPLLAKKFQPSLSRVVLRQMEIVGAEAGLVTQLAEEWLNAKRRRPFENLPVALQRRCLQLQLTRLGLAIGFDLVERLRANAAQPVSVSEGVTVRRDAKGILSIVKSIPSTFSTDKTKARLLGQAGKIEFAGVRVDWSRQKLATTDFDIPKPGLNLERFDADKMGGAIVLRHWLPGDRFHPIGMPSPVKLHDLFINAKVSREQRHRLLLGTTARGEIFWVEGLRLAEGFKLDKKSRYQLNWRWKRL